MNSNSTEVPEKDKFISFLHALEGDIYFKQKFESFNIFEAVGMNHYEIRHSNALSVLLDPRSGLGVGDAILKKFLRHFFARYDAGKEHLMFELASYEDVKVWREYKHIDLVILSEINEQIFVIENKVKSSESDGQLERYQKIVQEDFKGFRPFYIYLTPDEESPTKDSWKPMSYQMLYDALKGFINESKAELTSDAIVFIEHYLVLLERKVIDDKDLFEKASVLYEKHKAVVDFIIQKGLPEQQQRN